MRQEVEWWWKQANADFKAAKNSLSSKDFHASVFFTHQAVEKALKAAYIEKFKTKDFRSHNLLQLGKELGTPPRIITFLAKLSPEYALSRYPDASYGVPAERYNEEMVLEYIKEAEGAIKWAESQIKK